jgi:hypothetical protein
MGQQRTDTSLVRWLAPLTATASTIYERLVQLVSKLLYQKHADYDFQNLN